MNKEEAKRLLPRVKLAYGTANFTRDSYTACEWFETVEKALEQEPKTNVLDKIRAEIEQMNNIDYVEPITVDEVLQIIDKYR